MEYNYIKNNFNNLLNYKVKINKFIAPREDILISNRYELIKDYNDFSDLHFVIYYIDDHKCKIIIRRLDNYEIEHPIIIKIYNQNDKSNKFDLININNNNKNFITLEIATTIKLHKTIYKNTSIPKVIIQTGKSDIIDMANYNAILSFIELNPEFTYMYYDDNDIIKFIQSKFSQKCVDAYNKIIPGAYKADFFRYCILYIYGGFYFDNKQINRTPINVFLNDNDIYLCLDVFDNLLIEKRYYNAIMFSAPNHIAMENCIIKCIENIENNFYGKSPLEPTGPILLYEVAKKYKPVFFYKLEYLKLFDDNIKNKSVITDANNNIIVNICYKGYYNKEKNDNYYDKYWKSKKIYKLQ
jgi:mannosyltransferase OCH1-like enzyme